METLNAPQAYAVEQAAENLLDAAAVIRNMDVASNVFVSYRANAVEAMERQGKRLLNVATNLVVADCALALALDAQCLARKASDALESLVDYSESVTSDVKLVRSLIAQSAKLLS
jgi:hypothetical protein